MKRTNEFGVSGEQVEGVKEEKAEISDEGATPPSGEPEQIKSAEEKKDDWAKLIFR